MEPLLDENYQRKRPIVLYIIIGVLLIIIIILIVLLAVKNSEKAPESSKDEPFNPVTEDHIIPVTQFFYLNDTGEYGAYSYQGSGNHLSSEYFKILDVYNMKSNENRAILTHFKTYQQTSEYSSPCSLIIMILNYYNMVPPGERNCSLDFWLTPEEGCSKDNYDRTEVFNKSTIPLFAKQLTDNYKLEVDTCQNYNNETMPFQDESEFGEWVKKQISEENIPIVLYNDWGGQYAAIIGIDNLGTTETNDDVLILADAYDTTDHLQDGYTIWSLEKFYHLWQHTVIPFYKDDESLNHGQWILVKKPKSN